MQPLALIAIGGNAVIRAGEPATIDSARQRLVDTSRAIADVVAEGWRVVLTHGNGPQVGAALLRSEHAAGEVYPLPLDVCVASTQGEIGVLLQQALAEALAARGMRRSIAAVVTQVVVDEGDPAFAAPSKPIGPFYSRDEAHRRRARGWTLVEQSPHGWRRVVASPMPLEVVEEPAIRALLEANAIVITLGGGGVPVVRDGGRVRGIEAVVDKDHASALLATRLGCDRLVLATDVDGVYLDFGTPHAHRLDRASVDELRQHAAAGHFPPGTMGPKVEAAIRYAEATGCDAVVACSDRIREALRGDSGTRVVAGRLGVGEKGLVFPRRASH